MEGHRMAKRLAIYHEKYRGLQADSTAAGEPESGKVISVTNGGTCADLQLPFGIDQLAFW